MCLGMIEPSLLNAYPSPNTENQKGISANPHQVVFRIPSLAKILYE